MASLKAQCFASLRGTNDVRQSGNFLKAQPMCNNATENRLLQWDQAETNQNKTDTHLYRSMSYFAQSYMHLVTRIYFVAQPLQGFSLNIRVAPAYSCMGSNPSNVLIIYIFVFAYCDYFTACVFEPLRLQTKRLS